MQTPDYRIGRAQVRPASRELIVDGEPAKLGARAFDLLLALIERRDRIVSKSELLDVVWPGLVVEENNLQVQVVTLRRLLGQQAIATVPGRGYRLVAAVQIDGVGTDDGRTEVPVAAARATGAADASAPSAIPALPIHLIGRDADLDALGALETAHRLVTIAGPGGVGKTRVAQALAESCGRRFPDGAVWVDLAALDSPAMVPGAVATAVRAPLGPGDEPLDALAEALKSRAVLIILDNAEHLVDAAARVVQRLLEATPQVDFVVTSQVPLRIAGEQVYRLGTLQLPHPGCSAADALGCSAVALFAERATASARAQPLTDTEVAQIGQICRHLDGLPLAIELAAARAALLGLPALVRNIDQRFRMLGSGERTAPVRQQTLRAAFEWSHDLLAADAQIVFRRLAVFSGSFTLEAAQEVVADARIDSWSVVEHLAELIDRSLVALDDHAGARYRLLETARVFALDKLGEAGELDTMQHGHGRAMARLADQCFDDFWDLGDAELLGRYVPDLDNLRAALHRAGNEPERFARLAAGLVPLLRRLSLVREASALSQDADALPAQAIQPAVQARLWAAIAFVTYRRDLALRAIDLYRQLGDERGLHLSLYPLVHQVDPIPLELAAAAEESRRLRRSDWPTKRQAIGVATEGYAAKQRGDLARASRLLGEAIRLCDAAGADDFGTAFRMQQFAVTIAAGDLDAAGEQIEEVLARCRTLKNAYRLTCTQACLVNVRLAQGRLESARALAAEFASFDRALGWPHACEIADALSLLAAHGDRFEDAARLAGFADRVNKERGSDARDEASQMSRQRAGAMLQERLSADRRSMLREEGKSLDIDRAVALALQVQARLSP